MISAGKRNYSNEDYEEGIEAMLQYYLDNPLITASSTNTLYSSNRNGNSKGRNKKEESIFEKILVFLGTIIAIVFALFTRIRRSFGWYNGRYYGRRRWYIHSSDEQNNSYDQNDSSNNDDTSSSCGGCSSSGEW